jgi:prevent-host-death family protein
MTKQEVSIAQLRLELAEIVNSVRYRGDTVFVTKNNQRAAVILSPEEYERLLDPSKRLTPPERRQIVARLEELRAGIPEIEPKVIQRLTNKAVREVRAEKRKRQTPRRSGQTSSLSA